MHTHDLHLALYGNVTIAKGECPNCHCMSFIKHGRYVCCGIAEMSKPTKWHRESEPEQKRGIPNRKAQELILEEQGGRCYYCDMPLDAIRHRNGKPIALRLNWDHKLPYSATQNNEARNFVASCHVCNRLKSNFHFQTLDDARIFLLAKRAEKGYDF